MLHLSVEVAGTVAAAADTWAAEGDTWAAADSEVDTLAAGSEVNTTDTGSTADTGSTVGTGSSVGTGLVALASFSEAASMIRTDYPYGLFPFAYYPYSTYAYGLTLDSDVKVKVTPKDAQVFVDGYYAGVSDNFDGAFQRLHVTPGGHVITIYLDGYRTRPVASTHGRARP